MLYKIRKGASKHLRTSSRTAFAIRALILFALVFSLFAFSGCKKENTAKDGLTEVLKLDNCGSDNESLKICCEQQCNDFCSSHNMNMAKYFDNAMQCACWCE